MAKDELTARMERGNKVLNALRVETDRGRACVGDALLDELIKELFSKRLVGTESEVGSLLGEGQILGMHGVRLKLAHALGWIGPETFSECRTIHQIRNRMAHDLDVDSFDHSAVRDLVDTLASPRGVTIQVKGELKRANLKRREDRFLLAVQASAMRCWWFIDHSARPESALDPSFERVPQPSEAS